MELSDAVKAALDQNVYVHLATLNPDGSPQVSVVWVGRDGDKVLFSTAEGRVKTNNIRSDDRVALSFTTPGDAYKNYVMQGRVTKFVTDGFWLIDALARKYTDAETYEWATPEQVRVNGEIEILAVGSN